MTVVVGGSTVEYPVTVVVTVVGTDTVEVTGCPGEVTVVVVVLGGSVAVTVLVTVDPEVDPELVEVPVGDSVTVLVTV